MEVLGAMNTHLKASSCQVFTHLKNSILNVFAIFCIKDILFELIAIYFLGLRFIGKHQKRLVMSTEDFVDIDTDENLYLRDIS